MDNLQHPWNIILVLCQNAEVIHIGQVVDIDFINGVAAARGGQALQQPVDSKVEENWAEGASCMGVQVSSAQLPNYSGHLNCA